MQLVSESWAYILIFYFLKLITVPGDSLYMLGFRWLEAWLDLAVSGMTVRHRGPARAVLNLIQACCAQRSDPTFTVTGVEVLHKFGRGNCLNGRLLEFCFAAPGKS